MADAPPDMIRALKAVGTFIGSDLTDRISGLERSITGCDANQCGIKNVEGGATPDLLAAAYAVKRAAGQINVLIHAVGALLLLPQILEPGEKIEYVSLGAGNSGRPFDLETDRRVAEFKFIHWRGGADTIRQNALFKDFYQLAEDPTRKRKELYVLDTKYPLKFLGAKRKVASVLSRHVKLWEAFQRKHGAAFSTVSDYYAVRQHEVLIRDATPLVPELLRVADAAGAEGDVINQ